RPWGHGGTRRPTRLPGGAGVVPGGDASRMAPALDGRRRRETHDGGGCVARLPTGGDRPPRIVRSGRLDFRGTRVETRTPRSGPARRGAARGLDPGGTTRARSATGDDRDSVPVRAGGHGRNHFRLMDTNVMTDKACR